MRPKAIVQFERLILSAALIDLISNLIARPMMETRLAGHGIAAPGLVTYVSAGIAPALAILFWILIAHVRSPVAKWVLTVLVALAVLGFVVTAATGHTAIASPFFLAALFTEVLKVLAVTRLFTPEAKVWLGETAA